MKPISTVYRGRKYRSRLEARWAVFFDVLGIEYEYEPQGFNFGKMCYLPDFWLPEQSCWIEIKGQEPTEVELELCRFLAIGSGAMVYLFA